MSERRKVVRDLRMRRIDSFAVPKYLTTEKDFQKHFEKSMQLSRNEREKRLLDKRYNVVVPVGCPNNCVVFRVYKHDKNAFKRLRSEGFLCSKDTYTVETFEFVDYYYGTSHLPFLIPTCHDFFEGSISLLADNSFVLAAGSPDVDNCCYEDDDEDDNSPTREYELLNDKEIMLLPKILEKAIRRKFNLVNYDR